MTVLLDPTSERSPTIRTRLPRPERLDGLTIGLLDIAKARGDVFLDRLDERLQERGIAVKRRADGVIWFEFDALCEGPRAVADYIEIGQSFNTVLISNVPQFSSSAVREDAARRFVNLVDEFYDRGVNLVVSAAAGPRDLYHGRRLAQEFARTESRLIEMQSAEYLAGAHRH